MVGQGGNVAAGKPVVYTVENPTAPTGLLYQYWVDSAAGWRMMQNYSPDNVYAMRDVAAGSYQVVAYSLTPAALKARAWHDAASASHIINVGSSVSLAVMGAMSGMTANSTTVQAAAKNFPSRLPVLVAGTKWPVHGQRQLFHGQYDGYAYSARHGRSRPGRHIGCGGLR